jgi:hypothetical protein
MSLPLRSKFYAASALLAVCIAVSCAAGEGGDDKTTGGSANSEGAGASGSGSSGDIDLTSSGNTSSTGSSSNGCQQLDIKFEPQTPTVMLLVDRSGSMFDGGYWTPLKTAVLNVIEKTQDKVRYGLLTFTGIGGGQCPLLSGTEGFVIGNYPAIAAAYEAASMKPNGKLETPTAITINNTVVPKLLEFKEPGSKYIIFVTDGEPDRCDDVYAPCARDDVVGSVQSAYAQGIGTLVFGLGKDAFAEHLQDVANAGAGAPVKSPANALGACFNDWANAKGKYADAGGATKYYTPDPTDANALENALSAAVAGAQSCSFDLQGKIEVDLENASLGKVTIDGNPVPYDDQNGWTMKSATELELVGTACGQLKNAKMGISFDFPCEIIIPK